MKKIILFIIAVVICTSGFSQDKVHAKGVGINRDQALQDAFKAAVSQSSGVVLESYTQVENFKVIKDVVNAQTSGIVSNYEITKETPLSNTYEIEIDAVVSKEAIKKNADALQFLVGGIRFMVVFDPRKFTSEINSYMDYSVDRINEYLKTKEYRYIEREQLEELKEPTMQIMGSDTSTINYMQRLGMYADAQYMMLIKNLTIREQGNAIKATIEVKMYDNCQSEGLGLTEIEGTFSPITIPVNEQNRVSAAQQSIKAGISINMDRLLAFFTKDIGKWANNGSPYVLKIYNAGSVDDFYNLMDKMESDPSFGGAVEISGMNNYVSLRCNFKEVPRKMAQKIITFVREDPVLKDKNIETKLIYQRKIYFGVKDVVVPEVDEVQKVKTITGKGSQ